MKAKKSLGQHFLTSESIVGDIVAAAGLSPEDTVLEIGPGKGIMTKELLSKAKHVIAVEKDDRAIPWLEMTFDKELREGALTLIHGDILEFNPLDHGLEEHSYSIVANIPYYITGEILRLFLEKSTQPKTMVLLLQKEVAERITTKDGKESILSISVKAYGEPSLHGVIPASAFTPPPKVDSAVLAIKNISKKLFSGGVTEQAFFSILKQGFAHKRKTLLNNLNVLNKDTAREALETCNIDSKARPETLSVEDWICVTKHLN